MAIKDIDARTGDASQHHTVTKENHMAEAAIKPDLYLLQRLQPLASLPVTTLHRLAAQARIEMYTDGEVIFSRGEIDNRVLFLIQGRLEILTDDGRHLLGHSNPLASQPLSLYSPRPVTARARGRCSLLVVDAELLHQQLSAQQGQGYEIEEYAIEGDRHTFTHLLNTPDLLNLPPDDIAVILGNLERVEVDAGQVILWQGDNDPWYYILLSGRARVTRLPGDQSREITLAELGPGSRFGEEALITGRPRNASITMLTSGSVLRLHGDIFRRHVVEPFVPRVDAHQAFNLARRGATLIDVRSENDYRENGLGVNIPLPMLRLKLNRLDPAAPCLFCCDSGRLSQAAAFIARQQGYDARLVKGGLAALLSVQAGLP